VNDIVSDGLGDWYDLGPQKLSRAELTPPPVTATAFYFYNARVLSEIARVLDQPEAAREFAAQAERIRASYNREFFDAAKGSYATGSQSANALPLVMGIVEPQHRDAVFASLVRDVEQRDHLMTAGDVGFRFLLQALAEGGRSDMVYRMINRDDQPGYGYMLKMGATSLTESWDAKRTASHNHFMLGHITEWFYKDVAGIGGDPAGPGFKKIIIKPAPVGDLKWARASYNSPHGRIITHWQLESDGFALEITIPANTTATVFVPARTARQVYEGGIPATEAQRVTLLRTEGDRVLFQVEAGTYHFTVPAS
jgi:hypothetical protein